MFNIALIRIIHIFCVKMIRPAGASRIRSTQAYPCVGQNDTGERIPATTNHGQLRKSILWNWTCVYGYGILCIMYGLIMSDPPWRQSKGGRKAIRPMSSGKALDYPVMDMDGIADVHKRFMLLAEPDHVLFMWTIEKYLRESEDMARDLGYKLHCRMVWDKMSGIPAAYTVRFGHEYLLYMWKGKFLPVAKQERGKILTVFRERPVRHSQKPVAAYEIIERLYPDVKKIELFARNKRAGWDSWGNEIV